jgi:hypothetical protein
MTDAQIKAATALHVAAATAGMMVVLGWSLMALLVMSNNRLKQH